MKTRFITRSFNQDIAKALSEAGILPALSRVLASRGISCVEDLSEDWKSLLNPNEFLGLEKAAQILADLRETNGHVEIVADYDCDGATACAIAIRGLKAMGISADYLVPDRFKYGYGLSSEIVDLALKETRKPNLILTVDNGIVSLEGVAHARSLGLDVIITDHHLASDTLPNASAIVNPNLDENPFPSKALAGCGVMYYLLLALRSELRRRGVFTKETQPRLDGLSDLVALGTVADVVNLDKNNRILVSQGLARIRQGKGCAGIRALFEVSSRNPKKARAHDLAFSIAPRINAAGRLTEMSIGIDCLLTDDEKEALNYAKELDRLNSERRDLEEMMQEKAFSLLESIDTDRRASLVLFHESWHQGVVGLVASRVKEKIHRPVLAFALDEEGVLKGSGRSVEGIHLKEALETVEKAAPGLMVRFGGHAMAAGLTIHREDLERFSSLFESAVSALTTEKTLENAVPVDGALKPEDINFVLIDAINQRLWGQGFEEPLFANDFIVLNQRVLKGGHLKLWLDLDGKRFDAVYFRHSAALPTHVRLAYKPEINNYMGRKSVQLVVVADEN